MVSVGNKWTLKGYKTKCKKEFTVFMHNIFGLQKKNLKVYFEQYKVNQLYCSMLSMLGIS